MRAHNGRTASVERTDTCAVIRHVTATRYVTPLREGGSLPGLMEADDDGLYVTKFRGAWQGLPALVAEVIVGELARGLGLLVPELVEIEVDPVLGAAEPDPEIQELITASSGSNLGVDFLPSRSTMPGRAPDGQLVAVPAAGHSVRLRARSGGSKDPVALSREYAPARGWAQVAGGRGVTAPLCGPLRSV